MTGIFDFTEIYKIENTRELCRIYQYFSSNDDLSQPLPLGIRSSIGRDRLNTIDVVKLKKEIDTIVKSIKFIKDNNDELFQNLNNNEKQIIKNLLILIKKNEFDKIDDIDLKIAIRIMNECYLNNIPRSQLVLTPRTRRTPTTQ